MPRFHRAAAGLSFGLILLAYSALPALAQMRPSGFTTLVTAGSGSSVNGLLSAVAPEEMVDNAGSNPVWVNFGGISITAAPGTGYYLPAGQSFGISPGNAPLYMAAYGVGGTSTVYVTPGVGPTSFGGGGGTGSSSGGSVTAASGAFVDCAITTIGCEADTPWSGTGSATLVAAIKAMWAGVTSPDFGVANAADQTSTEGANANLSLDLLRHLRVSIYAQVASARNFPGCTVGATTGQCLAASTATQFVQVQNTSASASVACAWGVPAVLNSASSVQLAAAQGASWGPNTAGVPSGALNCIASGAATPLYLEWK